MYLIYHHAKLSAIYHVNVYREHKVSGKVSEIYIQASHAFCDLLYNNCT